MKPFLWMTCAVLAACAVGFSAYRMLVERMPDEIRGTRLVIEHDASLLPTMGMMRLENAGFSSMVHGLEKGKKNPLREAADVRASMARVFTHIRWTGCSETFLFRNLPPGYATTGSAATMGI